MNSINNNRDQQTSRLFSSHRTRTTHTISNGPTRPPIPLLQLPPLTYVEEPLLLAPRLPRRRNPRPAPITFSLSRQAIFQGFLEGDRVKMENAMKRLGNEREVREILNTKYKGVENILYMAVEKEDVEMVRFLLEKGANRGLGEMETPYGLAKRKGGEIFTLFEPRLKGMILKSDLCSICEQTKALISLECGHTFCYDCCIAWTKECISEYQTPRCPQRHCHQPITFTYLEIFLLPNELSDYHKKLLSTLPHFHWCPDCPYGFFLDESQDTPSCSSITCPQCTYHWCRKCKSVTHSNLTCDEAHRLLSKEEQECRDWKSSNTKPCPVCNTAIEKNNGCNHMTCTQCKYQFCWACLSKYNPKEPCC